MSHECHLDTCCGCCAKEQPSKRKRKIRQISRPLRPDELNRVLAQYGFTDTEHMPSAWIGPYPSGGVLSSSFIPSKPSHPGSVPTSNIYPTPSPHPVPSATSIPSTQVPLHVYTPTSFTSPAGDSTRYEQSPLAYSLSAELASVGKHRFRLTYVTDRLLVVSYPTDAQETDHNDGARWLCQAFERRYGKNYRIFNLSGFTKELHLSSQVPVIDLFWPVPLAPGLEQLVTAIDHLDYWLHNHDHGSGSYPPESRPSVQRVAVLHCTGPRSLLATYLAVYICQSKARFGPLCGQRPGSPTARGLQWTEHRFERFKNELVLGHMILKRFYEDNLARELIPSQRRYVGYFSGLVTGALILQDRLVYLHTVVYRNPYRGRYFQGALETILEQNGNGNSLYAQPEELLRQQSAPSMPGAEEEEENGWKLFDPMEASFELGDWHQLTENAIRKRRTHLAGSFSEGGQEQLGQLARSIESEMQPKGARHEDWQYHGGSRTTMKGFPEGEGGLLMKVYQNLKLMHTTRLLCPNVNVAIERYIFPIEPVLPLHGDILIACYLRPFVSASVQEIIFRLQFHTCALNSDKLNFYKHDLDEACTDLRFPPTGCVELYFSADPDLLQEHQENLNRGGYTWTSAERESTIIGVGPKEDVIHEPQRVTGRSTTAVEEPLSILISTKEYIFTPSTGIPSDLRYSHTPMWSDTTGGAQGRPAERIPRVPLLRQSSDPLVHPTYGGRSFPTNGSQWAGGYPGGENLFQQALLSPRVHPTGRLDRTQQPEASPALGVQSQIGRLNMTQLQALYQQLLNQQEQLNLQQQQQQQQQQAGLLGPTACIDPSGVYATVQRPSGVNLAALLSAVQRAITQQQQQQQRPAVGIPGIQLPQQLAAGAANASQLLSGLSTSTALNNLARALLPTVATGEAIPGVSTRLPSYSTTQPPPVPQINQSLQLTPQGLAYAHQQQRTGLGPGSLSDAEIERLYLELLASRTSGSLQPHVLQRLVEQPAQYQPSDVDLAEQRRRLQFQRARLALNDQERRLFDELRALRQQRAAVSRQEQQGRAGTEPTPLESYRRATGRSTASESGRGRGTRTLHAIGRAGSADTQRLPYGEPADFLESEDADLLALLEQRLARFDARQMLSEGGFADNEDIPVKAVGPQQRSGHVVDGSSRAIIGDVAPGEMLSHSRQPRIHLERDLLEPTDPPYTQPPYGRSRAMSGSPSQQPPPFGPPSRTNLMPFSPTQRLRPWGPSSYDEQWGRTRSRHHSDLSPGMSPARTPSSRLLRSPVSPPSRPAFQERRHYDTGSQSDTGLVMDYGMRGGHYRNGSRRPYRYRRSDMGGHHPPGRYPQERMMPSPVPPVEGHGPLDHVPESALITLNRLSASAHIWYRPEMSRNHAVDLVRADPPGTFVVRNSGSFQRSFGLVVKVPRLADADDGDSVRHYLIEGLPSSATVMGQAVGVAASSLAPSSVPMSSTAMSVTQGPVLLRGCSSEPMFTNLVSLLYEHAIQPLALPVTLRLPFKTLTPIVNLPSLIGLYRKEGGGDRARMYRSHVGVGYPDESPRRPTGPHQHPNGRQRGYLTRHPSDPLPGEASGSGYYHPASQSHSMPPNPRMDEARGHMSAYETEYGPMPYAGGHGGRGRTFTAVYLGSIDTENLTGASAIRKAVDVLLENASQVKQTEVNIKVAPDGLTVTDNWRKLFFRRHYPFFSVSHCATDPAQRCWESPELRSMGLKSSRIFGFVARKPNTRENMCHVLCDTPDFPANTVTDYITYRLNEY